MKNPIPSLIMTLSLLMGSSARTVMTWAPPYDIDSSLKMLNTDFGGFGMSNTLTHLSLQFWQPTKDGGIERVEKYGLISNSQISKFTDWGKQNKVKVLLCIYNGVSGWDWELAATAFDAHQDLFIQNLITEMHRLGLDGIDVDLEGIGNLEASKERYLSFIKKLSEHLHADGKVLIIDSFPHIWNAPNSTWWPELFPLVDGLNAMGYTETAATASNWRAYASLKKTAGEHRQKLLIGMPSYKAQWRGATLNQNLNWIEHDTSVGLAIWDARLTDQAWRTPEVWKQLFNVRKQ